MSSETTGALLPASINDGAAWAAFDHVQKLPWTLRFATLRPLALDVDFDVDFQNCLDGAGAFDFQKQARGGIAMRVLEIAASYEEPHLKVIGYSPGKLASCPVANSKALAELRNGLIFRLRAELQELLDRRPSVWAERMKVQLVHLSPEVSAAVARYSGLDQELGQREIKAGLNYVFQTIEPEILDQGGTLIVSGHERKLREARASRHHPDPKARARNLVVRTLEARVAATSPDAGSLDLAALRSSLESDLRERVRRDGCWGLIDAVIVRDRTSGSVTLPEILPGEVWDLITQQDRRIRSEVSDGRA